MSFQSPNVTPTILCGGSGTRLWPMSRAAFPKQFLQLNGDTSLYQQTLLRLADNPVYKPAVVVTSEDYRFHVGEQARQLGISLGAILLEPVARNTAPAISAAAAYAFAADDSSILHVLPSDHLLEDDEAYRDTIDKAVTASDLGYLVTVGIVPEHPATGYGYIKSGDEIDMSVNKVDQFIEKPPFEKAEKMLQEGGFLWNSGMFMFRSELFLKELKTLEPSVYHASLEAVENAVKDLDFTRLDAEAFAKCKTISVDYAVFERTKHAAVIKSPLRWSDIGSWRSLWEVQPKDESGNVVRGETTLIDSNNNLVMSEKQHVALNGVSNLTIVATDDALLVSSSDRSEQIKDIVGLLKNNSETSALTDNHKTVYRPWGGYTSILNGDRFQVKRLFVLPGKKLSLQKHRFR
ncbi:MAG: mannose-1-phosphate guanylyltransferase/mannose-6-phosphate isomerase, partial [Chloroflexota bacterium]